MSVSIATDAAKSGRTIREVAREQTALSEEDLDRVLDPASMTPPELSGASMGG